MKTFGCELQIDRLTWHNPRSCVVLIKEWIEGERRILIVHTNHQNTIRFLIDSSNDRLKIIPKNEKVQKLTSVMVLSISNVIVSMPGKSLLEVKTVSALFGVMGESIESVKSYKVSEEF